MTATLINAIATPPASLAQFGGGIFDIFYIVGIVSVIVIVLGGVASVVGLVYIWVRALRQPTLAQGLANCGRCNYGVRGAATMTCPECGADFREVGIVSPAMRRPFISPALFIVAWSLCLWIPGCVVSGVVVAAGPQVQVQYEDVDIEPPDTNAAGYDNIMFSRTPYGMYTGMTVDLFPQESRYLDVDIYGPSGNEWYEVDLLSNTYEDYSGMGTNPRPFDRATFESWIATVGGDLKNPDVQQQIDQAYNNIQQTSANGLTGNHWSAFTVNSQNNWSENQPAGWFVLAQPVFWLLVYVGGIGLYFVLKTRFDRAMAQLRDRAIAGDPYASPGMPAGGF